MTALAVDTGSSLRLRARDLNDRCAAYGARDLLTTIIKREFPGRTALVSSFGVEAAVLLHLVASIDVRTPVIFLDTGKLFGETLRYRDSLVRRLGLIDVRTIEPEPADVDREDPEGVLWHDDPDRCCFIRKVLPLERALVGFAAWINGRKGYHGHLRTGLPRIETAAGRIKINPLAAWTPQEMTAYFSAHDLPLHPLQANGFTSIGCIPCSSRTVAGEGARDGRWRGRAKSECGIHSNAAQPAEREE